MKHSFSLFQRGKGNVEERGKEQKRNTGERYENFFFAETSKTRKEREKKSRKYLHPIANTKMKHSFSLFQRGKGNVEERGKEQKRNTGERYEKQNGT